MSVKKIINLLTLSIFLFCIISCQIMQKPVNCVRWANKEAKKLQENNVKNSGVFGCHVAGSKTLHHAIWVIVDNDYVLYDREGIIHQKDIDSYWGWWIGPMIWEEQDKNWQGVMPPWTLDNSDAQKRRLK